MTRSRPPSRRNRNNEPAQVTETWDERLIRRLLPWRRELAGLILFVVSVTSLLGFTGLTHSRLLAPWSDLWRQIAGWGVYPMFLILASIGVYLVFRRSERAHFIQPGQVIGLEIILLVLLALSHMVFGDGLTGALAGRGGGLIGWALSEPLIDFLGPVLTVIVNALIFMWGLALFMRFGWGDLIRWLNRASLQLQMWSSELDADVAERQARRGSRQRVPSREQPVEEITPSQSRPSEDELIIIEDSAIGIDTAPQGRDRRLPPLDLLEEGSTVAMSAEEIDLKKQIIEETLLDFGLPALVTEIRRGPAVTQFGVQPGYVDRIGPDGQPKQYKVRVSQIAGLWRDLALALAVSRLRIEAPVPGRGIVGVEVPNAETSLVRLRPILESEAFSKVKSPLAVALGQDVAGSPIATDLGKLPHFLIAGTTGSGKSICLNALISCLVFNNRPEQLRLVMIDPKKVELIRFNGLPHLLGKVEVEPERVIGVLRWLAAEMDRRYELFAAAGAKHLKDYNRLASRQTNLEPLPYITVFVDELADLMAAYPSDVELTLCRLAQMARATGMHLVVATQRPSTDVITGLIKANFPARASFAVASGTDSRVILDTVGAEHLMGKGDMLFLAPDAGAPVRVQGCFVGDSEIEAIVGHWQKVMPDQEPSEAPWERLISREAFVGERDDMLEEAIALAQKNDTISTSLIQRRLRVGYPRAARLMEALYEMGLVEDPKEGGKTRRTFVDTDDDPLDDYLAQQ